MRFRRAGLLGSFAVIAIAFALMPAGALAANPNNHGHHYGQLKHRQPPPAPNPAPNPQPASHPGQPPSHGIAPAVHAGSDQGLPVAASPLPAVTPAVDRPVKLTSVLPSDGDLWWLVLLVLPGLALIWLIAAIRISRNALRRRSAAAVAF